MYIRPWGKQLTRTLNNKPAIPVSSTRVYMRTFENVCHGKFLDDDYELWFYNSSLEIIYVNFIHLTFPTYLSMHHMLAKPVHTNKFVWKSYTLYNIGRMLLIKM